MISGSNMKISDVAFYTDERLFRNNIINVTFLTSDYDTLYTDVYTLMKSFCKLCLLQECSDNHSKLTFVTACQITEFKKKLRKSVEQIKNYRKLKSGQLMILM